MPSAAASEPAPAAASWVERRFAPLALAVLLLHAALLALVSTRGLELTTDVEEGHTAMVAVEFWRGPILPPTLYLYTDYEAGSLLAGLLAAPFVAGCGETLLALRLAGGCHALLTLALAMLAGRPLLGAGPALLGGLLLACGPPGWLVGGLQLLGDTAEIAPAVLAACWLVAAPRELAAWRLGLIAACGALALSLSLAALPFVAAIALLAAARRPRGAPASALAACSLGALLGAGVLVTNAVRYGVDFSRVRGRSLWSAIGPGGDLLGGLTDRQTGMGFTLGRWPLEAVPWGPSLPRLYAALAALALLVGAWRSRAALTAWLRALRPSAPAPAPSAADGRALLALSQLLFLAAYLLTDYRSSYLLALLMPSTALLVADLAAGLWRGRGAPLAPLLLLAALGISLWPLRALLDGESTAALQARLHQPLRWRWAVRLRAQRVPAEREALLAASARMLPAISTADEVFGAGHVLGLAAPEPARLAPLLERTAHPLALLAGYGYGLGWRGLGELPDSLARCAQLDEAPRRRAALRGLGRVLGERFDRAAIRETLTPRLTALAAADRGWLLEGYGFGFGLHLWHRPATLQHDLTAFGEAARPHLYRGLRERLIAMIPGRRQRERREQRLMQAWKNQGGARRPGD